MEGREREEHRVKKDRNELCPLCGPGRDPQALWTPDSAVRTVGRSMASLGVGQPYVHISIARDLCHSNTSHLFQEEEADFRDSVWKEKQNTAWHQECAFSAPQFTGGTPGKVYLVGWAWERVGSSFSFRCETLINCSYNTLSHALTRFQDIFDLHQLGSNVA